MKRFERLYFLNALFVLVWFLTFYSLGMLLLLGKSILPMIFTILALILFLLSLPINKKRFAWHLERLNPNLKERLVSLLELGDLNHPSVSRLKWEVEREKIRFRPTFNIYLILLPISVLLLLALSKFSKEKPKINFSLDRREVFEGETLRVKTEPKVGKIRVGNLVFEGYGEFIIYGLGEGSYRITAEGYRGEERFRVISKPVLYGVRGFIVPPEYTGLPERELGKDNFAYEGSRFEDLEILHNGDSAKFSNLPKLILEDTTVYVRVFKKGKDFTFKAFSVKVIKDLPPKISINPSGIYRAEGEKVPVSVSAYDDIGLSDVGIYINLKRESFNIKGRVPNAFFSLEFSVDDTLKMVAYAKDVGGKISFSDTLILIPKDPLEELKEKLLSADRLGDVERRLREIEERIKADNKLSGGTLQEIKSAITSTRETYREIQEALERFSKEFNDPEISNLINEIRKNLRELMDEDLRRKLEELNKALENADPERVAKALRELRLSQKDLKRELERFSRLLERYRQERELRELSQKLMELSNFQREITGKPDSASQREISSQIDSIAKGLERYREFEGIDEKKLDELKEKLISALQSSNSALDKMRKGGNFGKDQAKTSLRLSDASKTAEELYNSLMENRTREVVSSLNEISDASAFINQRLAENPNERNIESSKMAVKDFEEKLRELSNKNVFVSPNLSKIAREIYQNLNRAQEELARGNGEKAQEALNEAREGLVKLSLMTSSSAQACQNSGGSGMEGYLRQLSRMAGEQGAISENLGQGLSPDELAELLARQMALNTALSGLIENMRREGMPGEILRKLEETLREMQELEKDMRDPLALKRLESLRKRAEEIRIRLLEAKEALRKQRTEPVFEAERPKPYTIKSVEIGRIIDRRVISEIYRKVLAGEKLTPQERRIYESYIRQFLE
jgi:hypothetical protein